MKHFSFLIGSALFCLTLTSNAATIASDNILNPGLSGGESFHLVFVTSTRIEGDLIDGVNDGTDNSTSPQWNSYVQSVASASTNPEIAALNWNAIVSVQNLSNPSDTGIAANVNAPVAADVYRTDLGLVATAANFYTSSHLLPINFNEFGLAQNTNGGSGAGRLVWTGSTGTGGIDARPLGNPGSNTGNYGSRTGNAPDINDNWINRSDAERRGPDTPLRVYALSELITIETIPEPSSIALLGLGALAAIGRRSRR